MRRCGVGEGGRLSTRRELVDLEDTSPCLHPCTSRPEEWSRPSPVRRPYSVSEHTTDEHIQTLPPRDATSAPKLDSTPGRRQSPTVKSLWGAPNCQAFGRPLIDDTPFFGIKNATPIRDSHHYERRRGAHSQHASEIDPFRILPHMCDTCLGCYQPSVLHPYPSSCMRSRAALSWGSRVPT